LQRMTVPAGCSGAKVTCRQPLFRSSNELQRKRGMNRALLPVSSHARLSQNDYNVPAAWQQSEMGIEDVVDITSARFSLQLLIENYILAVS